MVAEQAPLRRVGQSWGGRSLAAGQGGPGERDIVLLTEVIDTLPVPVINPYQSPMVLSGIAFNGAGEAFIATMFGDIWKVTGLTDGLEKVVWKRMIAGLNSPFGLTYHDGVLYAGDKAELIALHDLNGDDEFDFVLSPFLERHVGDIAFVVNANIDDVV